MSYDIRNDSGEGRKMVQRGLSATIRAITETYIWQPWLAQVGGNLSLTTARNDNNKDQIDLVSQTRTQSMVATGSGQLRLLPQSRFPFEAHIERNDNRVSSELVSVGGYASQRIGFTQHYIRPEGDAMFGWDHSTQTGDASGKDRQDNLQLSLTHTMELHRFQVNANRSHNEHDLTSESTVQNNLAVQHSYMPRPEISVETLANASSSGFRLVQADNDTRLMQVSSMAFWRPAEMPMTVTGGARMLALSAETSTLGTSGAAVDAAARLRNANLNLGATYDFTQYVHLNGFANVSHLDTNGQNSSNSNQSVGIAYQPETVRVGGFQYNWSTAATASNRTGSGSSRQLSLQLSHSLNRSFQLDGGSTISVDLSQALSSVTSTVSSASTDSSAAASGTQASSKQVTHGGSVSWSLTRDTGMVMVRLSGSDSRALDGNQEYFQLINFQVSSNLSTSGNTSWNGSLTMQGVRQGGKNFLLAPTLVGPQSTGFFFNNTANGGFVTTSSGSLTYQNQRVFGVRRLRYVSDLRLNGQALLPMLGGPMDQEMAAWENRLDYSVGRTLLRVATLVARTTTPVFDRHADGSQSVQGSTKVNKSIMFSVSRGFGDY